MRHRSEGAPRVTRHPCPRHTLLTAEFPLSSSKKKPGRSVKLVYATVSGAWVGGARMESDDREVPAATRASSNGRVATERMGGFERQNRKTSARAIVESTATTTSSKSRSS